MVAPRRSDLYEIGTVAHIRQILRMLRRLGAGHGGGRVPGPAASGCGRRSPFFRPTWRRFRESDASQRADGPGLRPCCAQTCSLFAASMPS